MELYIKDMMMKRYRWKCVACGHKNDIGESFCCKCFHIYETACKMSVVHEGGATKEELIEAVKAVRTRGYF